MELKLKTGNEKHTGKHILFIYDRQTTRVVFYRSCYRQRPCQRYSGEKPSPSARPSH